MAQADNTVTVGLRTHRRTYWCASMYSNDADTTGNLTVKAAPSSGNLWVDHILVVCDQDPGTVTINDNTSAIFGPWEMTAAEWGGSLDINFKRAIKLSGALKVDCGSNAPINVLAEGYTEA